MPEPANVSSIARSVANPTAPRTREPQLEFRLTNPTKMPGVQEPLLNRNGKPMGSLLVLDTRTRRSGALEEELLHAAAIATIEALEVRVLAPRPERAVW